MPKGCKYIYNNKTYTREEFMALLAGGEYRNILASAEQPIKVKLSRGSKEFVETTKQVADEVKSKVVPGKRHGTWINNKVKQSFETDISLDEVKKRAPITYANSIYTIASVVGGNDVIDSFEKLATNLSKQEQKDIINTALSMYDNNIKKIQKEKGKVQKRIDALIKRQDKLKLKGQELDEEDMDNLLSDQASLDVYGKMLSNKKIPSNDISSLIDFVKTIPSLGVKAQIMSEIIHSKKISQDSKGKWIYSKRNVEENVSNAESLISSMKDTVVSNLLAVYDSVDEGVRNLSKLWYDGANITAQKFAEKYGISLEQSASIIATQSPQKPWFQNLHIAQAVMDVMKNNQEDVFTKEDYDFYKKKAADYDKQKAKLPEVQSIIGKKLKDLSNEQASWFVRSRFEREMSRRAPIRIPTGQIVDYEKGMSSYGGYGSIEKAVSIYRDGSDENISKQIGDANKVRNFYNNIVDPQNENDVTIDTHAIAISLMKPLGSSSFEVNFTPGPFAFYADAYREAAKLRGVSAREMQSITWEAARAIFPAKEKTAAKKSRIQSIWNNYFNKNITLKEAQDKIFKDGKDPNITEWSGYTDRIFDAEQRKDVVRGILPNATAGLSTTVGGSAGDNSGVPGVGTGRARSNANRNIKTKSRVSASPEQFSNNVAETIDRIKAATSEDGATLNIDGTVYEDGGLVVPAGSVNVSQKGVSAEGLYKFLKDNEDNISSDIFKIGLYKFADRAEVSYDLNIVIPREHRDVALEFGKLAGQESLFDLDSYENIKTGSDGKNPITFTPEQLASIAEDLSNGVLPDIEGMLKGTPAGTDMQDTGQIVPDKVDVEDKFKQYEKGYNKVQAAEGGAKKRKANEELKNILADSPSAKYIIDNMSYIYKQLEDKGLASKNDQCPI